MSRYRTVSPYARLVFIVLNGALLTACSIGIENVDPNSGATPTPASSSSAPTAPRQDAALGHTPTSVIWPSAWNPALPLPDRAALVPHLTHRLDCASGSVEIGGSEVIAEISGPCDLLIVTGADVIVMAQSIGSAQISANGAFIFVNDVTTVELNGIDTHLRWRDGDPLIRDSGIDDTAMRLAW